MHLYRGQSASASLGLGEGIHKENNKWHKKGDGQS